MQVNIDLSTTNPKQEAFFKARTRYVGYGGARGGGKSWALRKKITLLSLLYAGIKILLLRRTYPELRENHINTLLVDLKDIAKYKESEKVFTFLNGSTIKLGYCASEKDVLQYQGNEYDIICLDEATQFTEYQYQTLTACLRGANDFPKRMYLTCNPGGVGHEWVKRLFISKRYKQPERPDDYTFIAATVFDNKILMEKDPGYVDMLNNLSDGLREAWRDGNWDMLAGQYFNEFDRAVHVIKPFTIPQHWKQYRTIDYGLDCLACLWIAIDESGNYYVYREYAESDKVISDGAKDIVELTGGEDVLYTTAPDDIWARSQETAKSKADIFRESGLPLVKANRNREAGWLAVKELLKVSNGESRLKIFDTCTNLIECLPALQVDSRRPTDCMTEPHEITHLPDALRYFVLQYVRPSKPEKKKESIAEQCKRQAFNNNNKRRRGLY
ncbi:MAG: phage terminase large subunit [Clostridia bacterium]|nr:phage terminase large subunit [Clostridia bacterium]